jgi:hypothetical protein
VEAGAATALAAILEGGWAALTARPFTEICPPAYDGSELVYTLRRLPVGEGAEPADASVRQLGSCTYDLGHPEALAIMERFEEAWLELGLPR